MPKVMLVLSDALRDDMARAHMGYCELLVETRKATRYTIIGQLPSLTRPCYETVHTGVPATEHGILTNHKVKLSKMPNVFSIAREHGLTTGAVAYSWFHELYNGTWHPVLDREVNDENKTIQYGRFYAEDDFPDITCYALAGMVMARHQPNYLLVHPMGLDHIGHAKGGDSEEYADQVIVQDQCLATFVPQALALGYDVMVTGDHGMTSQGNHNGTLPEARRVPLYMIWSDGNGRGETFEEKSQLSIAPTILSLLELPVPETMKADELLS